MRAILAAGATTTVLECARASSTAGPTCVSLLGGIKELLGDKAYDSNSFPKSLRKEGIRPAILGRSQLSLGDPLCKLFDWRVAFARPAEILSLLCRLTNSRAALTCNTQATP
jgi:hypothetical protein